MKPSAPKKKFSAATQKQSHPARTAKPAAASQLRAQTRKVLAKHYRAKYGVR